jgi:SAM-dependent methyltransferase
MIIPTKQYSNYESYIEHQKSKAAPGTALREELMHGRSWHKDCNAFREIFHTNENLVLKATRAVCLGARTGQEVHCLREMGIPTIGFDLEECPPYVWVGDVHNIPLEDSSIDFIFSNIFDHVLMPDKFISEIERIARPGTVCILELELNKTDDAHAVNTLTDHQDVVSLFTRPIEVLKFERIFLYDQPEWHELIVRIL